MNLNEFPVIIQINIADLHSCNPKLKVKNSAKFSFWANDNVLKPFSIDNFFGPREP